MNQKDIDSLIKPYEERFSKFMNEMDYLHAVLELKRIIELLRGLEITQVIIKNLILVMNLYNNIVTRIMYDRRLPVFLEELKFLIENYITDDPEWMLDKIQNLKFVSQGRRPYQFHYDLNFAIIKYARILKKRDLMTSAYNEMILSFNNMISNVMNYASRIDDISLVNEKNNDIFLTKYDPVEDTQRYQSILVELEAKIEENLKDVPRKMGFVHMYWHTKKMILDEEYRMDWITPQALNDALFD